MLIENGEKSAAGEEMSEDTIVHYNKDEPGAPSSAAAIRIDHAEDVLKPSVDAILAKYGLTRDPGRSQPRTLRKRTLSTATRNALRSD